MNSLHQASDYRPWLRQTLRSLRKLHPARTSRALATQLDIDPAHLSRVLGGHKHLAVRHLPALSHFLGLTPADARYLEALLLYNTATADQAHPHFAAMQTMRGAFHRTLEDDAHAYFQNWLHPVMRTLLSLVEFRGQSWNRLAALFRTPVTPDEARLSVELLRRLGLLTPDARGILRPSGTVSSGPKWVSHAVHEFQRQTIALSGQLLETVPRGQRDVSTLTIPASHQRMDELRDKITQFRQEIMTWARDLPEEDCVMQLNIQLFPIAEARLSAQRPQGPA